MILTRTPLRISIGGGGTDLPSYYREFGGFVISAAINKYVYISINKSFLPGYFLKYSEMEHVQSCEQIRHPLFREALTLHETPYPLEIVSIADVPAGTGLGSSGTFTVGLLHALYAYERKRVTAEDLAREAIEIEMNRLQEPVGKQDQYIAAYGGLLCQEYRTDDSVHVFPLHLSETTLRELRDSLMLFFVGQTRCASCLLADQKKRSEQRDPEMLKDLHFARQLGEEIRSVLESGQVGQFGRLMHEHWLRKRKRSPGMTSSRIDSLYEVALSKGGATGGKLVGAGGSGFLLFHTQDRNRLRTVLAEAGAHEMEFSFDFDGSVVMMRNA
ncbi:galactokinase [Pseudacidobacterium ailaaui]|jgi:D-glycero-alpha-D-manno-heptose-7-phosphate kinase|uniref:GHMP family kinase ATP-binding protein n=1 Tax=Pseudacidobacterium ailaaui TaxID=1382359 RepID=UPI00047A3899|nr:galactokinase [Pseudacidobacterium ailaaui]MBX6359376.1 galactokinase [Pseudacidobacterium ailaaui]MCL6463711.1 galactokinase [Pseudacidobacterium ailaaui]